jgi:nucleotide-binding universal stress UspA family protein
VVVRERKPLAASKRPGVSYRRILVPLVDSEHSEQAMAIACQLAENHGAGVTAVTVIEVPVELPLDAHMTEEEAHAKHVLDDARAIGDLYGVSAVGRILRSRAAGEAIVEEAAHAATEIIVLRAPRKRRSTRAVQVFGKTVDYVLKHAPCRVMVAASPPGSC